MSFALASALATLCAIPVGVGSGAVTVHEGYLQRSLEIIALAGSGHPERIDRFLEPNAQFALGGGDIVNVLSATSGRKGAIDLATQLRALKNEGLTDKAVSNSIDPCAAVDVVTSFSTPWTDPTNYRRAIVTFHYLNGRLRSAEGRWYYLTGGVLPNG